MEGYLLKWTNYLLGWKERFFVLRHSVLYYYYEKNVHPKRKIFLGLSSINSEEEEELMIEINTGISVIYIKGKDKEEKDRWFQALKLAKLEGENQLKSITNGNKTASINNDFVQSTIQRLTELNQSMKKLIHQSPELNSNQNLISFVNQYDVS